MTLFERALQAAYHWQNNSNMISMVIAVIGLGLIYLGYIDDAGAYVLGAVLILLLLWTKFFAAKVGLGRVWRCPHCGIQLPIEKGQKRGDPKWKPCPITACPNCKKKL